MTIVVTVFVVVYVGMILGTLPGLKVNRAAIALLGAIALLASGRIDQPDAVASINFGTIGLLFGLMIVAANFDRAFGTMAVSFRPYMVPYSLTIEQAASPPSSLRFLFYGAGLFVIPVILIYTVTVYWVFRGKIGEAEHDG